MEANGAPFTPLPLSVLRFKGSYSYTDRNVETDVEVTEDRTGDLLLRKPRKKTNCATPAPERCNYYDSHLYFFFWIWIGNK